MEKDFTKNQYLILIIKDYLARLNYDVYIHSSENGTMFAGLDYGDIPINNEEVLDAINLLLDRYEYSVIEKTGNFILFIRWSSLKEARGAVYTIDGSIPETSALPYLKKIEPMSKDRCFYFEED
ncbi:MAG: hypothetical protein LBB94_09555 [Clostridiales bacterium]|nr:hypothetical protein [Clostridiales bacterium]